MCRRPLLSLLPRTVLLLFAVIATVGVLGCSSSSVPQDTADTPELTRCVDPRPQVCTRDYRPVCGVSTDGSKKTYGNACGACSHQEVVGHSPGECVG